ncbi:MAG: TolC family protein [Terracidiphilus sp.]
MKSKKHVVATVFLTLALGAGLGGALGQAQAPAPIRLTLEEAIEKGLQANLNVQLASAQVDSAAGTRERRLAAALLPRVSGETYANVQNRSLAAFGISLPGLPQVVGPFSNYDFRLYAQQNVLDLTDYRGLKASEKALDADKLSYEDARDTIVRAVAALYLNAESAAARADAAQSRVTDAEALSKLAKDKHDAGTATGVDVLRAEVQLANDRQSLLEAQNQVQQALLELARDIGIDPGTPIALAETLGFHPLAGQTAEILVPAALTARADYEALAAQRESIVEQQRANRARLYPKVSINGNYGGIGRSIGGVQGTGMVQGQIDITLFDRDRNGEADELAAQLKSVDSRIADLRRGIEEDVRQALLNLDSAGQQVDVASQGQELAKRELQMTRDRFEEGTANNVEVITAQDELARAEENYILAESSYQDAKFALARALGDTQKNILAFAKQ